MLKVLRTLEQMLGAPPNETTTASHSSLPFSFAFLATFRITRGADVTEPTTKMSIAVPTGEEETPANGMKPNKAPEFFGCEVVDDWDELERILDVFIHTDIERDICSVRLAKPGWKTGSNRNNSS